MDLDLATESTYVNIDVCRSLSRAHAGRGRRLLLAAAPEPLSEDQAERIAPLLKALADPVRLRLLSLVASHEDGEACVCDLNDAFDLSQPTISHHLKVLHEVGLLDRSKRGVWVYYRIRREALADLGALIGGVTGEAATWRWLVVRWPSWSAPASWWRP